MNYLKILLLASVFSLTLSPDYSRGESSPISSGDTLPDMFIPVSYIHKNDTDYLGFERGSVPFLRTKEFLIHDIKAEVVFIEFFNIYCTSCQAQAPVLNSVYSAIMQNSDINTKVKFIGIGAGNNEREIARFKSKNGILFPLVPDPDFKLYELIGDPAGTPFSIVAKKIPPTFRVVSTHTGLQKDPESFINEIRFALETDAIVARVSQDKPAESEKRKLEISLTEKEIIANVKQSISEASKQKGVILNLNRLKMESGFTVYASEVEIENKKHEFLTALISRNPVCDICHGVHFLITFDRSGTVLNFIPLYLTKYGNIEWNETDVNFIKRKLVGISIKKGLSFNSTTDAVSFATMTSALIFNSINQLREVLDELDRKRRK